MHTHEGAWQGPARLWLHPGAPPRVSAVALRVAPAPAPDEAYLEYEWALEGTPHRGRMHVRGLGAPDPELEWVDTFHTPDGPMRCPGSQAGGVFEFRGTYAADTERWGWRTCVDASRAGHLGIRMYNVSPAGAEALAVAFELERRVPRAP